MICITQPWYYDVPMKHAMEIYTVLMTHVIHSCNYNTTRSYDLHTMDINWIAESFWIEFHYWFCYSFRSHVLLVIKTKYAESGPNTHSFRIRKWDSAIIYWKNVVNCCFSWSSQPLLTKIENRKEYNKKQNIWLDIYPASHPASGYKTTPMQQTQKRARTEPKKKGILSTGAREFKYCQQIP